MSEEAFKKYEAGVTKALKKHHDASETPEAPCSISRCAKCKGWGGQGTIGVVTEQKGNYRTCMIDLFGDDDNADWKPMFVLKITAGHGKGNIAVHRDFCCVNFNPEFEKK